MYEYKSKLRKVVDGDTVDVDIDLGFGIWLYDERVRIMGIDTPESRTRNKLEKLFGLAAKARVKELLGKNPVLKTIVGRGGEDMKGKFGRILGDFDCYYAKTDSWMPLTQILIQEGHAVEYNGQSKEDIAHDHLDNRMKILKEGLVDKKVYDKLVNTGKYR